MRRDEFERLAFGELHALYGFARFLTRDPAAAEDLVQDVYARAFRRESILGFEERGRGAAGMRAWLMTIARSIFYARLEHQRAGDRALARWAGSPRAEHEPAECPSASEIPDLGGALAGTAMEAALDALSAELREVLWLWAVEGLKYREIAAALGVPLGTVMSRLHRARASAARTIAASTDAHPHTVNPARSDPPPATAAGKAGGS